ncbi:hypothetical protein HW532_07330 [Kaustia mangrovi]|uniref:Uncharacterized protein n=1 Tax=Kaustia mangrovi TaxID=2593653 RepID=A0A7S8C367_9HYPH|nr:hypothetical protein [Kaustia mangrovi]QPC42534.1 hypothetical protein HW532_07330 [Kaustia mangrovi]
MASKDDIAEISAALAQFRESGELDNSIDLKIREFLKTGDDDILAVLQGDLSDKEGSNPIVCCYIGYSGYRYKWLRADVCARFGSQVPPGQEHKCGLEP